MGIIKTAMMSGVAVYGVKQLAKSAESHRNSSNNSQARAGVDSEYLEWLEWKRRSANSAPPALNRSDFDRSFKFDQPDQSTHANYTSQQQLYLAPPFDMPPSYSHQLNDKTGPSQSTGYQLLESTDRSNSSLDQLSQKHDTARDQVKPDLGALFDQGMTGLQARRGGDQVGSAELVGKFLKR